MSSSRILLKIAAPAIALSLLLLAVGITAAWHVQRQQQESSQLVAREVHGMLAAQQIFTQMREIRRELDLLLRTHNHTHLTNIDRFLRQTDPMIDNVKAAARTPQEEELVEVLAQGYREFRDQYSELRLRPTDGRLDDELARLCDDVLTNRVLKPATACIDLNTQVVERTTEAGRVTAQNVRIGFLLLGITGSVAGLLIGLFIARAVSRSIVRLDVSVRSVAGKLNEVIGPVQISHFADFSGLETSIRNVGEEITQVVARLQQKEIDLLRSEQLATVGQLAAGMAHELRNPLMPVKVLVQSALARGEDTGLQRRQLQIINEELIRLEDTIQTFLDFARPPALVKVRIPAADLIYQAVDLVMPKAFLHEVELHTVVPAEPLYVDADPKQLRQVLLNVVLNALDALGPGGLVQIVLEADRPRTRSDDAASLNAGLQSEHDALHVATTGADGQATAGVCRMRILDNGPGFTDEALPRLFEPFFTTKDTGTGLGLPICRQIVRAHAGEITARNRVPHGAEFVIELPLNAAAALPPSEPSSLDRHTVPAVA
jgi:two-component system sensor histidine kinase HydH